MDASRHAARRASMPVRVFRLGEEPPDPPLLETSAEQRIEMLVALSTRMAELSGRPVPRYTREDMPFRVFRPR